MSGSLLSLLLSTIVVSLLESVPSMRSKNMKKLVWLNIFFVMVIVLASQSSFQYALGEVISYLITVMVISLIWWALAKNKRQLSSQQCCI